MTVKFTRDILFNIMPHITDEQIIALNREREIIEAINDKLPHDCAPINRVVAMSGDMSYKAQHSWCRYCSSQIVPIVKWERTGLVSKGADSLPDVPITIGNPVVCGSGGAP